MTTGTNPTQAPAPHQRHADAGYSSRVEPQVALPAKTLLLAVAASWLIILITGMAIVFVGSLGQNAMNAVMAGTTLTAGMVMLGVVIMTPWKCRAMADWMTMWLAGTVFRVLVTPVVVFLLYSAAASALAVKPLVLSVALTYLVTLLVEAAVLARHLKDTCLSLPR